MTIAEFERAYDSYRRRERQKAREKASYDYILADLIGKSVARLYSSSNNYPEISEAYPAIFDSKEVAEKKREKQAELSALRFRQYADFHNKKFKKEVANKNE